MGNCSVVVGGSLNCAKSIYNGILGGKNNDTNSLDYVMIVGSDIIANRVCTTFVNQLSVTQLPTVAPVQFGLYYDPATCIVKYVP